MSTPLCALQSKFCSIYRFPWHKYFHYSRNSNYQHGITEHALGNGYVQLASKSWYKLAHYCRSLSKWVVLVTALPLKNYADNTYAQFPRQHFSGLSYFSAHPYSVSSPVLFLPLRHYCSQGSSGPILLSKSCSSGLYYCLQWLTYLYFYLFFNLFI